MATKPRKPRPATATTKAPSPLFLAGRRTPREVANAELHIALVKAAARLQDEFRALTRPVDISAAQYNVLRILRGSGPEGTTCGQMIERLIQRDPDVTRLVDRLAKRGLVERHRDERDRRVVRTRITDAGLELLASLDDPINALHQRHLGKLTDRQLAEFRKLLEDTT